MRVFKFCGEFERVGEEAVSQQDTETAAPFGNSGRLSATNVGTVHDVVVNQRCDVDEFENDGEARMAFMRAAGSTASKHGESRADPFAGSFADVAHISFDTGIERTCLFEDGRFHAFQVCPHEMKRKDRVAGANDGDRHGKLAIPSTTAGASSNAVRLPGKHKFSKEMKADLYFLPLTAKRPPTMASANCCRCAGSAQRPASRLLLI